VISRHFVSAIAVAAGAAAPTSSLPYYLADFAGLRDWTAAEEPLAFARAHADAGERAAAADETPAVTRLPEIDASSLAAALPPTSDDASAATPDEWMTVWLARQYPDGS